MGSKYHKALFYERKDDDNVRCQLCPHFCHISPSNQGICGVRQNQDGNLYTLNYGQVTSAAMDPIEKKPLYHFHPGSTTLSLGTRGCNLSCSFCQNWRISQGEPGTRNYSVDDIVELAQAKNSSTITFTYSEPVVWYEFIKDVASQAEVKGLGIILVTNGFIAAEPLEALTPYLSACNIDLKSVNAEFYKQYCGGGAPEPVKETIVQLNKAGVHLEVTNLLIPGANDSQEELKALCDFISEVDEDIPLHLSRYFPRHKLQKQQTPRRTMVERFELAKSYLNHVYLGNIDHPEGRKTICPDCSAELIDRSYFQLQNNLQQGKCHECGREIKGRFN